MNEYTIYCTEEQTKKALELGAPLFRYTSIPNFAEVIEISNSEYYEIPTGEQMIGWLKEQGIYIIVPIPLIKDFNKNDFSKADAFEYRIVINGNEFYIGECLTNKEATLEAIDKALEYIKNLK